MLLLKIGSIIPERQDPLVVQIALAVIACIALMIAFRSYFAYYKKSLEDAEKKNPKKKINISRLNITANRLGFTKNEKHFLGAQCKQNNIFELPLIFATEYCIESPFKKIYRGICENTEKLQKSEIEDTKLYLFMLITKLENAKKQLSFLTSTIAFPVGAPIAYVTKDGLHNTSIIIENTNEGIILAVSVDSDDNEIKPVPFSKITLYLELKGGIAYQARTRVVRYQTRNTVEELLVTHSNNIKFFQRRKYCRVKITLHCTFKAVTDQTSSEGTKTYIARGKDYKGEITDLSAGGCRLKTNLPIHASQYMQIRVPLSDLSTDIITGVVIRSGKDSEGKWCILNMRFVKMSKKARNNIFSIVYNYSNQENDTPKKTQN